MSTPAPSKAINDAQPDPTAHLSMMLKAAADPLRLEILRVLAQGSYGVLELCQILDLKQSGLSHHLKVLAQGELVATRREGNSIFYRRSHLATDHPHFGFVAQLFETIDQLKLSETVQHQLNSVARERASNSQAFFAANANKFREQQDLIASYDVYKEQVSDILNSVVPATAHSCLEIGPGEGEFLSVLAKKFNQVTALDNSLDMLNRAQRLCQQQHLDNVQLVLGDSSVAIEKTLTADCIVMNMVLHHVPNPAELFQHSTQLLHHGGALIVTDLCHHNQQWVTESCGDLWLGFEPEDLTEWAAQAGLNEGQSIFFALRNGFQIQIRHFLKI
ncbi:ArsR/SmtB family transcription factor [Aurantivibrio plasticivorans]